MIYTKLFAAAVAVGVTIASTAIAAPPVVTAAGDVRAPRTLTADFRKLVPRNLKVAPALLSDKLVVLKSGGIVVRDLPVGPPRVTVAKPINGNLSVSYYGVFGVSTDLDFAMTQDGKGFIALNWNGAEGAVYLVDCELPSVSASTKIEFAIDGSGWQPAQVANGHLLVAVPPAGNGQWFARAFAFRSPNSGFGFHGCEVSKVK